MIKAAAAILDSDTPGTAGQRLARTVDAVVAAPQERAWVVGHLRPLIGLDDEAEAPAQRGRVEAFAAWRRFFESLAAERPTVLVFEDLHWADAALREFVDVLGERAGALPLAVVATARPELLDGVAGWGDDRENATVLTLSPLSEASTTRLLDELLGQARLPVDVQRALLDRIEGHPLYTREYVRMLWDRRLLVRDPRGWRLTEQPEHLPESLYGVIAARLDLLPEAERRLVQDAAVFGRTAWVGALSALSGRTPDQVEEQVADLERTQLLRRAERSTMAGETEVSFTHALVQDVAYSQISRADRAERHIRAAAWLERREDRAELLAYHYATALRIGQELGQETEALAGQSRRAHIAAGRQADAVNGYAAAAGHYAAAEALMPPDDPERAAVLLAHAIACYRDGAADAAERLSAAFDAQVAAEDWWAAAEAAQLLGDWNREYSGDLGEAARWWDEAGRMAERGGHRHLQVRVADGQAARLTEERRYADAIALADQAIERARGADDPEGVGLLLVRGGYARVCSGESSGISLMREATGILSERNSRYAAWANIDLSLALMMLGDLPAALGACEQGLAWAERFGEPRVIADAESRRAFLAYHAGDWQTAREITGRYIDTAGRWSGAFVIWTHRLIAVADGDDEAARADDEAMREFAERVPSARALQSRSAAAAALAAGAEVEGYRNWEIYAALELMSLPDHHEMIRELASRMPSDNPWRAALTAIADGRFGDAAALLDGIGSLPLAAEARLLAAGQGPSPEAGLHASRALEFYQRVGATRDAARAAALVPR
jgi:tetratricopeptide (TPR) repeat protein